VTERVGRVDGKVAIVTGAGSIPGPGVGSGKATSVVLAREGARVLLVDMHPERAEETLRMIADEGGTATVFEGDMTRAADCEAMVKAAVDAFGTVDILVNNIGSPIVASVTDLTEAEWDRGLDVNLRTAFLASKHVIPVMVQQGGGSIVNVSSIAAVRGNGAVVYSTAKGAMLSLTVDMAYCHGRDGVRVNAVVPGHIKTPMIVEEYGGPGPRVDYMLALRAASGFLGTEGTGWDVAWAAAFLASDEARWITGVALPVDAGMLQAAPMVMSQYLFTVPRPDGR
jgi:NAD(P)-dependent dehydrogenase (short-subunit alcohol dehydrogenase family)